jgi:hypothetical protein
MRRRHRRVVIDYTLVAGGFPFATPGDRFRYLLGDAANAILAGALPEYYSPPCQLTSLLASVTENVPDGSTQTEPPPGATAATTENTGPEIETTPLGPTGRNRGGSGSGRREKLSAGTSKVGRTERMRIFLNSFVKRRILCHAAEKAGIHRKTAEYWLQCSAAGDEGYDIRWRGITARFHEHYEAVIAEADDKLSVDLFEIGRGGIVYKTDPFLEGLGFEGRDAAAKDEYGDPIVEAFRRPKPKILLRYLERKDPERWGKQPKRAALPQGGRVLVVGGPRKNKKPEKGSAASVRARRWKADARMISEAKAQIQEAEGGLEDDSEAKA